MTFKEEFAGKVLTVLGPIGGNELGFTLPHEHLLSDVSPLFVEPPDPEDKLRARRPVSLENLRWVRYHRLSNIDNARLQDEETADRELRLFKIAGGNSLVELTNIGIGRNPAALVRLSKTTGINIIMGSGYYIAASYNLKTNEETEQQIAAQIISDITKGTEGDIRSGIIGEVGCSYPLKNRERKVLRAAAYAQQETGAAINVHPAVHENSPFEAVKILQEAGAQLSRIIISHMDRCGYLLETRLKLLEAGCYLEYDTFGTESYFPAEAALAQNHLPDMPNDVGRIKEIVQLIDRGYLRQILISQDISHKSKLACWGGPGYAHILENVLPLMRVYGCTEEHIRALTVENPKNVLAIR